ncbi:MAG: PA2779 family protein [Vicinamibacterales bacterium]|nr:PA2779 family protein [Vicinamibacterales bacterium]
MRRLNTIVALALIPLFLFSAPALAQQPGVVDASSLSQALAGQADDERAQRELVRRVLDRADVREVASQMGLDVGQASSAVATLSGDELSRLAGHAGAIEGAALAGGANTIVISVTTLLLLIIIIILLAD